MCTSSLVCVTFLQRVLARVPHGGGARHRRRQECLHLVGAEAIRLQPHGELEHVLIGRAGMRRDEVRNQVLLLAGFLRILVEQLLELVVRADARLHHLRQRAFADRFGRDLEIAADVMLHQFLHVLRRFDREVIAHARTDQHFLDTGQRTCAPIQLDQRHVIRIEIRTDAGIHARWSTTGGLDLRRLAGEPIHVRRRTAEIRNHTGESRHGVAHRLDLFDDRVLRAVLNDATFVFGDRTERAAAETAALDRDREANHLVRRNLRTAHRRDAARADTADRKRHPSLSSPAAAAADSATHRHRRDAAPARAHFRDWIRDEECAMHARTASHRRARLRTPACE